MGQISQQAANQVNQLIKYGSKLAQLSRNPNSYVSENNPIPPEHSKLAPESEVWAALSIWAMGEELKGKILPAALKEFNEQVEKVIRPNPPTPKGELL